MLQNLQTLLNVLLGWLNALFGCSHQRTTFPLTLARESRTYVTCLDCGKEFDYDWKQMRIATQPTAYVPVTTIRKQPRPARTTVPA